MIPILIPIGLWVGYSLLKNSKAVAPIVPSIEVPGVFPWGTTRPYSIRDAPSPDLPSRDYYPPATPPETIRSASLSTLVGDLVTPVTGALGSKTNPIKLNKPMVLVDKGYMSGISPDDTMGGINLPGNTKLYFEVDPLETTGISASSFGLNTKFYNQAFSVCKSLYSKVAKTFSAETWGFPSTYRDIVYDNQPNDLDLYKYLYGVHNDGPANFRIDVWVTINP